MAHAQRNEVGPANAVIGLAWLAGLAATYYLCGELADRLAATRDIVDAGTFAWEARVPFVGWTVYLYPVLIPLYAASFSLCTTRGQVTRHGCRLLTVHLLATVVFIALPLASTADYPGAEGTTGRVLTLLSEFGSDYNQALSLHTALLIPLFGLYRLHATERGRLLVVALFLVVGLSALTVRQHHAVGLMPGIVAGLFADWLWPESTPSPLSTFELTSDRRRLRLASYYGVGAAAVIVIAWRIGAAGIWLLWPAVSPALVSAIYTGIGEAGFRKRPDGSMGLAAKWLLAPYILGAWVNSRLWTFRNAAPSRVSGDVWIGRFPSKRDLERLGARTVVDTTAELPAHRPRGNWRCIPMLDLVTPSPAKLREAADTIRQSEGEAPVLVCCALGYGRSAAAVATWLLRTGKAPTLDAAIGMLRQARPETVLHDADLAAIEMAARL